MQLSQTAIVGLFTGLVLGLGAAIGGLDDLLIVAFFGAVGFIVAKIVEGEIDLSDYVGRGQERRRP
jgi:hypothetical protein